MYPEKRCPLNEDELGFVTYDNEHTNKIFFFHSTSETATTNISGSYVIKKNYDYLRKNSASKNHNCSTPI